MYYAYLVISLDLEDSWLKEWLLNGIAFPVLSVLVGRLLVADLMSFLFMWVFPPESHRAVLTFYTILVRLNFSIASQIAILRLTSTRAFVLSAIAASVMEAAGTLMNVKMCDYIRRKAQDYKLDAGRMDKDANVMAQWLAMRSQLAREKLILHTHDEVLGEKVVILAATVETVLTTNNAAQALALRGTILFIAQVLQELLQRAILRWCAEVSLTSNELRYHSWQDNVVLASIIVMTLNFFTASEDLV
ncbi:Hypothetical Protein FCC1311_087742 [Hondaea fermentalgiana]|uniref:Uncharacterized protein n=1 Tax=Hondaea fermentalgiana TaxID=2315210 RepID=A0A2R5GNU4_9STRA|nr:Hypothetical Protein FCC1311_087742 [Hondaea fermentalgiana]|eukprot:GBG32550.1 Hypothetical Protein FCC1311_087742 [Hondaea fermentalgiana]